MRPEFSVIVFQDPTRAEANVARLEGRLPAAVMAPLASLLAHSPDPDGALNFLERYAQSAPAPTLAELSHHPTALTYLVAIFGYSESLAETFLSEPDLAVQFARDRHFTRLKSKEDLMQDYARFSATQSDPWLASRLAAFKRRNYLRIALKDVLGFSTVAETTLELSALADVLLANSLAFCDLEMERRYGQPQFRDVQGRIARSGFSILSLGKLGGNELNYSSDVDLLFLYAQEGETSGGSERDSIISNKEYAVRLAHALTRTLTQMTPHGQVFRVDLRLRPEGEQGDLAISVKSASEYYEHRARDWELQMLIKARHSAGNFQLSREFLRGVEPLIYTSPSDLEAVESLLASREKISGNEGETPGTTADVKRHRGGIRDIEFLTQCLQRLYGAQDPWVRASGTLLALRRLNDKGWLSDSHYARLTSAYEFFRKVEHRVQIERGKQTHRLPVRAEAMDRLARRIGVHARPGEGPGQALIRQLEESFARVDEIYQRVIHRRPVPASRAEFTLKPPLTLPPSLGPGSYESLLKYFDAEAPELAQALHEAAVPDRSRKSITRFLAALLESPVGLHRAREDPQAVRRAIDLAGRSEYFADVLIHHPEDLSVLNSGLPRPARVPEPQMRIDLATPGGVEPFPWVFQESLGVRDKMALLRRDYRARILGLGDADLSDLGPIFPALLRWSDLAAQAIATALWIATDCSSHDSVAGRKGPGEMPFVILGLGRLGLGEFDLASDADLVFVCSGAGSSEEAHFWTSLAEKTIEVLSSYTRDGTVLAVDTRLRPRGQEGELVTRSDSLMDYLAGTAQVWEALTYLKAYPIAGNLALGQEVVAQLWLALKNRFAPHHMAQGFAGAPQLEAELHEMRRRLERDRVVPAVNLKTAPGGYYDVDFAVSYLRLRQGIATPPGANMTLQVAALRSAEQISDEDSRALTEGAAFLRSLDHAIRLVTGKPAASLPEGPVPPRSGSGRDEAVESVVRRWGLVREGESLPETLRHFQQQIRYVYRRLVGSE